MGSIPDLLDTNFEDLSVNDLIVTIGHAADKAETHIAFQGDLPEYVKRSPQLRQLAEDLGKARDAAAGHDQQKVAEKKALMAEGKHALTVNAHHITLLSIHRNDPTILLDAGYKHKQKLAKAKVNLLDLVPEVSLKHGGGTGVITIVVKRAKGNASLEVQMTDQSPDVEGSWRGLGEGTYNRSRIEIKGLQPASRVHFRARYHEDGGTGRWSTPVSLIVL